MNAPETAAGISALPLIDLNRDRREERRQTLQRSRRHVAAILATAAAVALLAPLTLHVLALQRDLRKTQRQMKENRLQLQSVTAANAELDGQIKLWERLKQTQQSRRAWGAAFPALAACLPQNVFLQQVEIAAEENDVAIQLQGAAGTMADLRAFANSLQESPFFAQVHLDEATTDTSTGHGGLSFRLTGPIPIAAGAASAAP